MTEWVVGCDDCGYYDGGDDGDVHHDVGHVVDDHDGRKIDLLFRRKGSLEKSLHVS